MTTDDRLRLSAEKTALERMIARTPASQVIDRASLTARLSPSAASFASFASFIVITAISAQAKTALSAIRTTCRIICQNKGSLPIFILRIDLVAHFACCARFWRTTAIKKKEAAFSVSGFHRQEIEKA